MSQIPVNYRALESSHRNPRAGAKRTGDADPNEVFTVSVRLRRRSDAPALPDPANLSAAPQGQKPYLSREDFAATYGASQEDLNKIAAFAQANSLTVVESSIPRRACTIRTQLGPAAPCTIRTQSPGDRRFATRSRLATVRNSRRKTVSAPGVAGY